MTDRRSDPAWIQAASDQEVWQEVSDAWLVAVHRAPDRFEDVPGPVLDYVALVSLVIQTLRNGMASFFVEEDPRLSQRLAEAARAMGHEEIATLYTRATAGLDLSRRQPFERPIPWADADAAQALEARLRRMGEVDLFPWIRDRAEDFAAPLPT